MLTLNNPMPIENAISEELKRNGIESNTIVKALSYYIFSSKSHWDISYLRNMKIERFDKIIDARERQSKLSKVDFTRDSFVTISDDYSEYYLVLWMIDMGAL